jgi:hypothetical protein
MAVRETAAQKRTRIAMLLADYSNRAAELRKLSKIVDGLKEQVREIPLGVYGEWQRSEGTPREIADAVAIKARYAALGETLPTKMTEAPIVVRPVAGK